MEFPDRLRPSSSAFQPEDSGSVRSEWYRHWRAMESHLSWSKKASSAGAHCQAGHERVTWSLVLYNPIPCPGRFQFQQNAFLTDDSDTELDLGNVAKTERNNFSC